MIRRRRSEFRGHGDNSDRFRQIVENLGEKKQDRENAWNEAARLIDNGSRGERLSFAKALGESSDVIDSAVTNLAGSLLRHKEEPELRSRALVALIRHGGSIGREYYLQEMQESRQVSEKPESAESSLAETEFREYFAQNIAEASIVGIRSIPFIKEILANEPVERIRLEAVKSLGSIGLISQPEQRKKAVSVLSEAVATEKDKEVVSVCGLELSKIARKVKLEKTPATGNVLEFLRKSTLPIIEQRIEELKKNPVENRLAISGLEEAANSIR